MNDVTIFSIDNWQLLQTASGFEATWSDTRLGFEFQKGIGCYKGQLELCYIVPHETFNLYLWGSVDLKNQESVLHVVKGIGYLEFLGEEGKWVTLGEKKEGQGPDGWTYINGEYFHF